jgi:small multidrug resistance pump
MTATLPQIISYLSLFIAIALGVLGQLAVKAAAERSRSNFDQFLHPLTISGVVIYGVAGILYVIALRRIPVSVAFPSVALSYIALAVLANYMWRDPLGRRQWLGLALIAAGVIVLHF